MNKDDKKEKAIHIDIDPEIAQGTYSNLALSNFNQEEFILDFAFLQGATKKCKIASRIIMSPGNTKRLADMLTKNIQKYESKFGPITGPKNEPGFKLKYGWRSFSLMTEGLKYVEPLSFIDPT